MKTITVKNEKIINFYKERPHLCFETINLAIMNMLSTCENSDNNCCENSDNNCGSLQTQILDAITDSNNAIKEMKSNMNVINRDYMNNMREIVETCTNETVEVLLTENNRELVNRTMETIVDIVPKSNDACFAEINTTLTQFYESLSSDTKKLSQSFDSIGIKEYLNNFEMKSTLMLQNIHQPIYSFISASEERTNKNMNDMKEMNDDKYNQLLVNMNDIIKSTVHDTKNISVKQEEKTLMSFLSSIFGDAELFRKQQDSNIILMKRMRKTNVLLQSFDTDVNLSTENVRNFRQMILEDNCSGILMSHNSGISTTTDYEIEIQNNNVLLYIHNLKYSTSKIDVALHIIDNLHTTLYQTNNRANITDNFTIPCDVLENINNEYQVFIKQKKTLIEMVKENQKKMLSEVDNFQFPFLDKYLSSKYTKATMKPGYKCDICKLYNAQNLKALAAHKRGCSRKHGKKITYYNSSERDNCITPIVFDSENTNKKL